MSSIPFFLVHRKEMQYLQAVTAKSVVTLPWHCIVRFFEHSHRTVVFVVFCFV